MPRPGVNVPRVHVPRGTGNLWRLAAQSSSGKKGQEASTNQSRDGKEMRPKGTPYVSAATGESSIGKTEVSSRRFLGRGRHQQLLRQLERAPSHSPPSDKDEVEVTQ